MTTAEAVLRRIQRFSLSRKQILHLNAAHKALEVCAQSPALRTEKLKGQIKPGLCQTELYKH